MFTTSLVEGLRGIGNLPPLGPLLIFTPTQHFFTALPSITPGTQRVNHLLARQGKQVRLHES